MEKELSGCWDEGVCCSAARHSSVVGVKVPQDLMYLYNIPLEGLDYAQSQVILVTGLSQACQALHELPEPKCCSPVRCIETYASCS